MKQPEDKPCQQCGELMHARMPSMPLDWPGSDEYDHYWCEDCGDAFDLDEVKP